MVDEAEPNVIVVRKRHPVLRWIGGIVAAILLLISAIGLGVDTDAGHRFIVDRIGEIRPSSGLRIHIGRIDGSIWRHARIKDLRLYDTRGLFLEAPAIQLDWRPTRWLANRLHIDRLASDLVILHRLPALKPTGKEEPILPGYRIHIGALDLRLRLEPGVAGVQRRLVRIVGQVDTGRGRAVIGIHARSSAGDSLALALDTEPDRNLFDLDAKLRSPVDGVVPGLFGARRTVTLDVQGDGTWTGWHGHARLDIAGKPIADLALNEAKGRYALAGRITASTILTGKGQRLTAPIVAVVGAARYEDRRIDGQISLASPAMRFGAKGVIDLARGTFDRMALDLALLKPAALFPNMTGQDIRLHATLDGAFRRAAFRYALASPRFAFDQTGFEGVQAAGAGHLGGPALILPIKLVAKRVTGVGDVAGGILANLSVTGTLKITTKLLSGEGMDLR
ncbi:MAG: hypothetical protein JWO65_1152, partial [Sphingomonas bacterium]|nr:hypothetical protein [Sphingomonas bacterium]